jgi:flagellar biosynthesis protein FlhF
MKIIRHTARDMRQALRAVREQLGEDAVILSSRRTGEGVEVTAAVDFDASTLEAGGFATTPATVAPLPTAKAPPRSAPAKIIDATPVSSSPRTVPTAARSPGSLSPTALALTNGRAPRTDTNGASFAQAAAQPARDRVNDDTAPRSAHSYRDGDAAPHARQDVDAASDYAPADDSTMRVPGRSYDELAALESPAGAFDQAGHSPGANFNGRSRYNHGAAYHPGYDADWISEAAREAVAEHLASERAPVLAPATPPATRADQPAAVAPRAIAAAPAQQHATSAHKSSHSFVVGDDDEAHDPRDAEDSMEHAPARADRTAAARADHAAAGRAASSRHTDSSDSAAHNRRYTDDRVDQASAQPNKAVALRADGSHRADTDNRATQSRRYTNDAIDHAPPATPRYAAAEPTIDRYSSASYEVIAAADPVEEIREATLTPLASNEVKATFAEFQATAAAAAAAAPAASSPAATEAMGNELRSLRRMLETQLAHLAWNDLTRRAPVHTEILRELTEIGITQDLAEHLVRQLPEDTDLTFARRFTIAGLSQYLKVTGDRWLDDGGRVAFVGATGVGKTTTLAKIAVRWVLRHGPRDIALVAADSVRIGAQDQLQSLAQLLGVPVYTPESFDQLPALLSRVSERLILIDTPGSSVRDTQLAGRLAVLSNSASKLETALVLAASTQAGAIEESVRRFASANPSCCVLTKIDEAASLGGVLSALIRARLPVSYMSEGQRVPEDLRPARALELVSAAVRLAKARGAAADEDLLRRRFGKTAHGIS